MTAPAPVSDTVVEDKPVEEATTTKDEVARPVPFGLDPADLSQPRLPKPNRRLSARITGWAKGFGSSKKEQSTTPKEEVTEGPAERQIHQPAPVSDEAPRLEQPVLAEPIKIEQVIPFQHDHVKAHDTSQSDSSTEPTPAPAVPATA